MSLLSSCKNSSTFIPCCCISWKRISAQTATVLPKVSNVQAIVGIGSLIVLQADCLRACRL